MTKKFVKHEHTRESILKTAHEIMDKYESVFKKLAKYGSCMQLVKDSISLEKLKIMSERMHTKLVKAVVDIEQGIMVVDADLHADEELFMLEECGSKQEYLWGINLHPNMLPGDDWIEFDSMINIRPSMGNRGRSVDDPQIRAKIVTIVNKLVVQ